MSPRFSPTIFTPLLFQKTGRLSVQAEPIGQWAVHVTYGPSTLRDPYSVSHIPSGRSVKKDMPLAEARALAQRLHEHVPSFQLPLVGDALLHIQAAMSGIVRGSEQALTPGGNHHAAR